MFATFGKLCTKPILCCLQQLLDNSSKVYCLLYMLESTHTDWHHVDKLHHVKLHRCPISQHQQASMPQKSRKCNIFAPGFTFQIPSVTSLYLVSALNVRCVLKASIDANASRVCVALNSNAANKMCYLKNLYISVDNNSFRFLEEGAAAVLSPVSPI